MTLGDVLVPALLHLVLLHVVDIFHLSNPTEMTISKRIEHAGIAGVCLSTLVMHQDPSGPGVALEKSTMPEKSGFSGSFGPGWNIVGVFLNMSLNNAQ